MTSTELTGAEVNGHSVAYRYAGEGLAHAPELRFGARLAKGTSELALIH
jgi:hypothetical protein